MLALDRIQNLVLAHLRAAHTRSLVLEAQSQQAGHNLSLIHISLADFLQRMDLEVDSLTKIGTMTIQAQDMPGAQRTIIRSAKLKEMRDRVNDLSNEWNAVVSE